MTGNLQINATNPGFILNKSASGGICAYNGYTNGVARWGMNLGDPGAESGSNAGSDFALAAYSDAGALLGNWLQIQRASGSMTLNCVNTSSPAIFMNQPAGTGASAAGYAGYLVGRRAGAARWAIILGDNAAESGSNAGSNFDINGWNDAGTRAKAADCRCARPHGRPQYARRRGDRRRLRRQAGDGALQDSG
jgi:hypothetical protein